MKLLRCKGSMPCYMNAVNEVLVQRFLRKEISWGSIANHLEELMNRHAAAPMHTIDDVLAVDQLARLEAAAFNYL